MKKKTFKKSANRKTDKVIFGVNVNLSHNRHL